MPFIKELEDVLKLVEHLPEKFQKGCAYDLRLQVREHEESTTMTKSERAKLELLGEDKRREKRKAILVKFEKIKPSRE